MSGKEKLTEERLHQYFKKEITPKEFSTNMRRFLYSAMVLFLERDDLMFNDWMEQGYVDLTQFLEVIDPQLE
jgi:hypothetical protein